MTTRRSEEDVCGMSGLRSFRYRYLSLRQVVKAGEAVAALLF